MRQAKVQSKLLEVPDTVDISPDLTIESQAGSVKYGHYYVETSNGKSNGSTVRVMPYAKSTTSTTQAMDVSLSASSSWSINSSITGKWKDAVTASPGSSWTKTYSASITVRLSVAPRKTGWVESTPSMQYSIGCVERKFWDRTHRKWIILSAKSVTAYSPLQITASFGGKTFKSPDGTYIFKEKNN